MEIVKVIINADGITAKEVNQYGTKKPTGDLTYTKGNTVIYGKEKEDIHKANVANWEKSEASLRTFGIDESIVNDISVIQEYSSLEKSVRKAYVFPNGKIKFVIDTNDELEKNRDIQNDWLDKLVEMKEAPVINGINFQYTAMGKPIFIKDGAKSADSWNAISPREWTIEQLEAMVVFMKKHPLCKLMNDG